MTTPSLDTVLESLHRMFPSSSIDPDVPLGDLDIDSMDLLEWLYSLVDEHGLDMDEEALQGVDDEMTIRDLYTSVFAS